MNPLQILCIFSRIGPVEINAVTDYVKQKKVLEPQLEGRIVMNY